MDILITIQRIKNKKAYNNLQKIMFLSSVFGFFFYFVVIMFGVKFVLFFLSGRFDAVVNFLTIPNLFTKNTLLAGGVTSKLTKKITFIQNIC